MKIPVVPLEDLPYTLSMVAAISSQHGIERIQSNCSLSPLEYLGDKTSAQVTKKRKLLLTVPLFLGPDLLPQSFLNIPSFSLVTQRESHYVPSLALFNLQSLLFFLVSSDSSNVASLPVPEPDFLG